ncbi:T9SS type A sorting domain-containing protein [Gracilimonas mengyeensis]|uniref:Por secretion system C-terminal sorting domain-containing protein n=1 Tax=Gracilimonas mengyeensis TaxID=1302730 RepID=A0A521E7Z5_9BACT|nr:T9SS type A sorting domain-containing protein [Gracilimonas mengyeensis]SMO80058.1 Por secretion system C-terminal sorting domain-containing protein [Gracilimonas mengyeensis]
MKSLTIFLALGIQILLFAQSFAQQLPFVYDKENTCEDCPTPALPEFRDLSRIDHFPNPFEWSDGRGVIQNKSDWKYRRHEIGQELQAYEIGQKPSRPDSIEASYADGVLTVQVTVNGETLTLTSNIILPSGSLPGDIFTSRDIAQIPFNFGQVMAHTQSRGSEPINELYPELTNMGAYAAWPWGVSRLIDGLELVKEDLNIDLDYMGVTGCSFAGKMALFSGALDERIALTISIESGGGGYTSWRYSETMEGVEQLGATNSAWFKSDFIRNFGNDVNKLPFDHHELMAMVAPRALFVTGNDGWTWLADESGTAASMATQKVYDALGVPDRFGYYNMGGHSHCQLTPEKRTRVEAFVDRFLMGDESVDTDVAETPYDVDIDPWTPWETPALGDGTSFLETAPLQYPDNKGEKMDSSLTFRWNQVADAETYYFQLSANSGFTDLIASDSTADSLYAVSGLQKGKEYYWRVQVRNNENILGPWSEPWSFVTDVPIPGKAQLISEIPSPSRSDYINFNWKRVLYANRYEIHVAEDANFETGLKTSSTSDTVRTIFGTSEGTKYFWRVRASNISGEGPWSEVQSFVFILPPDDLQIAHTNPTEISLRWSDNSDVEEGYIIERKIGEDGSFTVIDSLEANSRSYEDRSVSGDLLSYSYRIKAYVGMESSHYTTAQALTAVSNEEEMNVPSGFSISQNYPNPFNPTTQIRFGLATASHVKLEVFNIAGQKVDELVNEARSAGFHTVTFDAQNLASGIYIYRLDAGDNILTNKMILMK